MKKAQYVVCRYYGQRLLSDARVLVNLSLLIFHSPSDFLYSQLVFPKDRLPEIEIFRYDEKDPKPVNKDTYSLHYDLFQTFGENKIQSIVENSSTSYDNNLINSINNNILLVKNKPGDDHWLNINESPKNVQVIINKLINKLKD